MNDSKYLSNEQMARIDAGWSDKVAADINAQYPEAVELDWIMAAENMHDSVYMDQDLGDDAMSIMELYAASLEGLLADREPETVAAIEVDSWKSADRVQEGRERIAAQVEELRNEVYALEDKGFRLMPGRRAQQAIVRRLKDGTLDPTSQEFTDLLNQAEIAGKVDQVDRLEVTLHLQLMQVNTRYVITSEPLVSPAGFDKESRVFVQTTIAIHCDEIPEKVPYCNTPLMINDMEAMK